MNIVEVWELCFMILSLSQLIAIFGIKERYKNNEHHPNRKKSK